ncbi:putative addiction module antitoxin [Selenomonas ruminantium subsp. lactilytica TAM6421]|uniref:Putative addiction module antitoxin n=1 Tax=Selenomonas ruminantium subsp. lactilytica (strain NBRC 103574 / TAM6421) TaxID=927704 RepID=I0GTW6_SELRL|nr:type II toxin-antitoxin system RelB/DinJ family antitoxin [Selenomonas ruminantium]BAL84203.1 putative addiction module antitoxin [Selenomonas ruminantium subsp. lactilytica TAM6421]
MATMTKSLNLRVDAELKAQAEHIFSELGLPTSTAINMFLKSVVRHGGIPFSLRLDESPNKETIRAMEEVNTDTDLVGPFHSVEELMEELNA